MAELSNYLNCTNLTRVKVDKRLFDLYTDKLIYFIGKYHFDSALYWFDINNEMSVNKFYKAFDSYVKMEDYEYPFLCYDGTISGSADDGLVVTNKKIYIHNYKEDTEIIPFTRNPKAYFRKGFMYGSIYIDDIKIDTSCLDDEKRTLLCELINEIVVFHHKYGESSKKQVKTNGPGEWVCSCGTNNIFDFCSECGAKKL